MTRFPRRLVVVVISVAQVAAACGGDDGPARAQQRKPPATTTTVPIPIAPLTGLPDPTGVTATRAALQVKIENTPEARPQSGLDVADVVYEEVVEGGITRFWAVFSSNAPETVGPIRSVRFMDPDIVSASGGVVAYSGGTEPNVALIRAAPVVWVDENNAGDAFFREPTRRAPHNLFGNTALLWQRGGVPVPPRPLFTYLDVEDGQTFVGEPVAQFELNFDQGYDVTYVWDPTLGWSRIQHDEPFLTTALTQLSVPNVVVQFVEYGAGGEGQLIRQGGAWIFAGGQLVRGLWSRAAPDQPTLYTDAAGAPIALPPGRTWVELFPAGLSVDVTPGVPPSTAPATTTTRR